MGKFDWQRLILSLDIPAVTKLVALALSIYASKDGGNVHPGNRRLGLELGLHHMTVMRHIGVLRDELCVIERTSRVRAGRPRPGVAAKSDVYRLVLPWDLPARAKTLDYDRDEPEVVTPAQPLNGGSGDGGVTTSVQEVVTPGPGSGDPDPPEVVTPQSPHQVVNTSHISPGFSLPQSTAEVEGNGHGEIKTFDYFSRQGTDQARQDQADALTRWMAEQPEGVTP